MQNEIKKKVNLFGKTGKIIVTVLLVIVLVGGAAAGVCAVFLANLPDDAVSVSVSGKAKIHMEESLMGILVRSMVDSFAYEDISQPGLSDMGDIADVLPEDTEIKINLSIQGADYTSATIHSDGETKYIEAGTDEFTYEIDNIVKVIIGGIVYIAAAAFSLFVLRRLFKEFEKCDTPFTDAVVRKLYAFAFSLIPVIIIASVAESMAEALLTPSGGISFHLNCGLVIAFVVTICLCTTFKYGTGLQQESDETL